MAVVAEAVAATGAAVTTAITAAQQEAFGDPRRHPICQPGHLVYSGKMDQDKLECWYCFQWPCWACLRKEQAARRSFVDVYTNGVMTNAPRVFCCFVVDSTTFILWDDIRFGGVTEAGCCKPYPCCCPNFCGCCGDAVAVYRMFGCCFPGCGCCPLGIGHTSACFYGCCCSCCILDVILGLQEGEGSVIMNVITQAKAGQAKPLMRVPMVNPQMFMA